MGERVILTAAPESEHAALGELRREGVPVFWCAGVHEKSFPHRHTPTSEHRAPGPCRLAPGILRFDLPGTFTELAAGRPEADALAAAQRMSLRNSATADPFYWAGFTLSGGRGP